MGDQPEQTQDVHWKMGFTSGAHNRLRRLAKSELETAMFRRPSSSI